MAIYSKNSYNSIEKDWDGEVDVCDRATQGAISIWKDHYGKKIKAVSCADLTGSGYCTGKHPYSSTKCKKID